MDSPPTTPKKPIGRPKKRPTAPSKKARLVAAGTYETYKANQRAKKAERDKRNRAAELVKEGVLSKEEVEAWKAGDPEVRAAVKEERRAELTAKIEERRTLTVKHAVKVELARRELARRKLLHYIQRLMPAYTAAWVHEEMCELFEQFLEDVVARKSPRLMVFVPPRHGKSEIYSVKAPAWTLGKYPHLKFINTSYAESLQLDFSRRVQEEIRSDAWKTLFPKIVIDRKNEGVSDWTIAQHGGGILATGVGGPLTGRGADILLVDDPVKNREEADSPVIRESTWKWYMSTAYSRLSRGGGVILVQTRWHHDDLAGRLLAQQEEAEKEQARTGTWPEDVFKWKVVRYPAIATQDETHRKRGDALAPERKTLVELKELRRNAGDREWASLYQQTPTLEEGAYFKRDMLRYYTPGQLPEGVYYYAAGDLAISKKEQADYTVFVVVAIDRDENLWLVDLRRARWDSAEIIDTIFDIHRTWQPRMFGIEKGQIEMAIGPFLDARIREEKLWDLVVEPLPPGKRDKELRARPIQGRMKQGKVFLPQGADWLPDFINELLRFPAGVKDDQVDAFAWIGQMLDVMHASKPPAPVKRKSWKDNLHKHVESAGPASAMAA